jgi:membrane associated rhomboid family serine protease
MGSGRYLSFYLLAGLVAGLAHVLTSPNSRVPTVGASGAIAGVLGAYFILFPRARVTTFVPLFFLPWFIDIPALAFIGIWFFTQLSQGLLSLGAVGDFGGIAWWAHIGGFAFGVLLVRAFVTQRRAPQMWRIGDRWTG